MVESKYITGFSEKVQKSDVHKLVKRLSVSRTFSLEAKI